MNRLAVIVLCIAGSLLLLVAGVAIFVQVELASEERFVEHAVEVMSTPAAAGALAGEIYAFLEAEHGADEVLERETAEAVFANVLRRPSARGLLERVARSLHRGLVAPGGGDVMLPLGDEYQVVEEAVAEINPAVLALLPPSEELGAVRLLSSDRLPRLGATVRILPWSAALAAVLGALLLGVGIFAAEPRTRGVMSAGFGLSAGGGLLVAVVVVAPTLARRLLEGSNAGELAAVGVAQVGRGLVVVGVGALLLGVAVMMAAGRLESRAAAIQPVGSTSRRPGM